jgi:hypothetical protein
VVGSKRATRRHCFAAWCGVVRGGRKRADVAVKSCDARVWTSASRWPLPAGKESDGNGAGEAVCVCVCARARRCGSLSLGDDGERHGGEVPAGAGAGPTVRGFVRILEYFPFLLVVIHGPTYTFSVAAINRSWRDN